MRLLTALALALAVTGQAAAANAPIARHTAKDTSLAQRALIEQVELGKGWQPAAPATGRSTLTCTAANPSMAGIVETGTAAIGYRGGAQVLGQVVWVYKTEAQAATLWRRAAARASSHAWWLPPAGREGSS